MSRTKLSIEIRQLDNTMPLITTDYIVAAMNKRFITDEQFLQQIDVICIDIAKTISKLIEQVTVCNIHKCVFSQADDVLLFDCTELKE
jgi:hypothetical protein